MLDTISSNTNNLNIEKVPLARAEEIWNTILAKTELPLPMFSYEWYQTWVTVNSTKWDPYILLIDNQTIAPFIRNNDIVRFASSPFTDFNDIIGPIKNLWPKILQFLINDHVKRVEFENIVESSETVSFFKEYLENNTKGTITADKTAPFLTLPPTFKEYLSTIKNKRRKYHKFEREYPNSILANSTNIDIDVSSLITLMKTNPIKLASFTREKEAFFKQIAKICPKNISLQVLKIRDETIATMYIFLHEKKAMLYISGYDREKHPNAGTYFMITAVKHAIENGYEEFSFLLGKEQYKYELGAKDLLLYSIAVDL